MNKTTLIIVVVVLLILLGGGIFYFLGKSHTNSSQAGQAATSQKPSSQITLGKKSLSDFFSMTGSLKCTFSNKTDNSSGNVYVAVGKMRGDFQSVDNGTTMQTHMVNDGKYIYMWTEGQKTGYKMSLASIKEQAGKAMSNATENSGKEQASPQGVINKQSNYTCSPWAANTSLFVVPTDITFTDYTAMMQGAMHSPATKTLTPNSSDTKEGSQAACAQCDQAPAGAARNQCKTILKCQ